MATHRERLSDDINLALAFAALGFTDYPVTRLSVESLTEFKQLVDVNWGVKLTAFQKARKVWAAQNLLGLQKAAALATAQSKLDAAEARAKRDADAWERMAPEEQETGRDEHGRQTAKTEAALAKLKSARDAALNAALSAERTEAKLREMFDATYDEMMDARRAEELARALPEVWAGDQRAADWFENQVGIVRAYSPMLAAAL